MDEGNRFEEGVSNELEGVSWDEFFERVDQLNINTATGFVSPTKNAANVTACVATLPYKKASCYGSCPTEETESLRIVRCKYCELIVKVVGYGHHMRQRHGYRPPPSSASNSGDDCQDFLLSPPHVPMVASTSAGSMGVVERDCWAPLTATSEDFSQPSNARQFGSPTNSRICSPPYYDLVLVLSKRLPGSQSKAINGDTTADSLKASKGMEKPKRKETAAELRKLKKLTSSLEKQLSSVNSQVVKAKTSNRCRKTTSSSKQSTTTADDDPFIHSGTATRFSRESSVADYHHISSLPTIYPDLQLKTEEEEHTMYMPQLSPSASENDSNQSTRPTTRLNSLRNTPKKMINNNNNKKLAVERKKKAPNMKGTNSKQGCVGRPTKGGGKKAVQPTEDSLGNDDEDSISPSSTCSELSMHLTDAQRLKRLQAERRPTTPPGLKQSPSSDSESTIIAKLLKLPGLSVTALSPHDKRSPLKMASAPELLSRVKECLSSDIYNADYRKRMLRELDAKNVLMKSPDRSSLWPSSGSGRFSGNGRTHQTCSLPLSPSSESNYSSSSVSNDEAGCGSVDGVELHCSKPALDAATAKIRAFFLKSSTNTMGSPIRSDLGEDKQALFGSRTPNKVELADGGGGYSEALKSQFLVKQEGGVVEADYKRNLQLKPAGISVVPFFKRNESSASAAAFTPLPARSSSIDDAATNLTGKLASVSNANSKQRLVLAPCYKPPIQLTTSSTMSASKPMGSTRFVPVNSTNVISGMGGPSAISLSQTSQMAQTQQQQQQQNSLIGTQQSMGNATSAAGNMCNGIGVSIPLSSSLKLANLARKGGGNASQAYMAPTQFAQTSVPKNTQRVGAKRKAGQSAGRVPQQPPRSPISLKSQPVFQTAMGLPSSSEQFQRNVLGVDKQAKAMMAFVNGSISVNENGIRRLPALQPSFNNNNKISAAHSVHAQHTAELAEQRHQRAMMVRAGQATGSGGRLWNGNKDDGDYPANFAAGVSNTGIGMMNMGQRQHRQQNTTGKKRTYANTAQAAMNFSDLPPNQQGLMKKFRPIVPRTQPRNAPDPIMVEKSSMIGQQRQSLRKVFNTNTPEASRSDVNHYQNEPSIPPILAANIPTHSQQQPYFTSQSPQQQYGSVTANSTLHPNEMQLFINSPCIPMQKVGQKQQQQQPFNSQPPNYRPIAQKRPGVAAIQVQSRYNSQTNRGNVVPSAASLANNDFSGASQTFVISSSNGAENDTLSSRLSEMPKVQAQRRLISGGIGASTNQIQVPPQLMYIPSPNQIHQQRNNMVLQVNGLGGRGQLHQNIEPPPVLEAEGHLVAGSGGHDPYSQQRYQEQPYHHPYPNNHFPLLNSQDLH